MGRALWALPTGPAQWAPMGFVSAMDMGMGAGNRMAMGITTRRAGYAQELLNLTHRLWPPPLASSMAPKGWALWAPIWPGPVS